MANKQYKWFLTKRNRMMKKNNSVITDNNDFHNHMKKFNPKYLPAYRGF